MNCCKVSSKRKCLYIALAVLACVGVLFAVIPMMKKRSVIEVLDIKAPKIASSRAALPELAEVEVLMNNDQYYDAIDIVENLLKQSDKKLLAFDLQEVEADEEVKYEYSLQKYLNDELRWVYIYLLVVVESERNAVKELKKYLSDDACVHREEAEDMLSALK